MKIRLAIQTGGLLLLAVWSAACRPAVSDGGTERIISLSPAVTESLFELGVGERIVGVSDYCQRPPQVKDLPRLGSPLSLNVEAVVALRPDRLICTAARERPGMRRLRRMGVDVTRYPFPRDGEALLEQFLQLGRTVGREKQAREIVRRCRRTITEIRDAARGKRPAVMVQIGQDPLWVARDDTYIHDYIEWAGGRNIAAGLKSGRVSLEYVIQQRPEIILISGDMGHRWDRYDGIPAVKGGHIYRLPAYALGTPTPTVFAQTLRRIRQFMDRL